MTNGMYLQAMGKKIRATRNARGITLRNFAKLCNLDYSGLCKIENGRTSPLLLTLKLIADKLEVDVKDLI